MACASTAGMLATERLRISKFASGPAANIVLILGRVNLSKSSARGNAHESYVRQDRSSVRKVVPPQTWTLTALDRLPCLQVNGLGSRRRNVAASSGITRSGTLGNPTSDTHENPFALQPPKRKPATIPAVPYSC